MFNLIICACNPTAQTFCKLHITFDLGSTVSSGFHVKATHRNNSTLCSRGFQWNRSEVNIFWGKIESLIA